ncbi:MAG: PatB family C-S lyase [Clostridia bacterium]|nr:PatB family C-S lyase [Clostridia bacterium]
MKYDRAFFDAGIDRRNTLCEKWDDREVLTEGAIPLWVADMDFPCAQPIVDALLERAKHAAYGYNMHDEESEKALCDYWQRRHGLTILPEQTRMLPCVVTGLKTCIRAFTKEGDGVAIFTPVYGPFFFSIRDNNRKVMEVAMLRDEESGRYSLNLEGMEKALQDGAKMIMFCNPHNPVSRNWSKEELAALCDLAGRYRVPLICDEIHADFVYAPHRYTPILSLPEAKDHCVMLCAASKTFNVAGLQQATAVSFNPDMLKEMEKKLAAAGVTSGNTFALCATKAAYQDGDAWLDGLMIYLDENRQALAEYVQEFLPKAKLTPVEATYLAWLDLRAYGKTCDQMAAAFRKHGVALTGGTFFGNEGEGFMRVNFGCPREMLKDGIKRMKDALEE